MRKFYWTDLTTKEFETLDPGRTIAVLPIAAVEQHGPHLTVATDTAINQGMLDELVKRLPQELSILILPIQAVGKSNEHIRSPGTLTLSAETALRAWIEISESVARAGLRKLAIVNSHGGNSDLLGVVTRELRIKCEMLAVHTAWSRFGKPDGLFTAAEGVYGIHAGDVETSLMLHFRPDLVRPEKVQNFISSAQAMEKEFAYLRPTGLQAFGWISPDLNPHGAVGDASLATAEKGRLTAEHQVNGFIALLEDMAKFDLARLA
ncbi:creatinine amidohydrolase [Rhizobiales bacterium GAS191]|nr:creatinine amidohydrolase [Rhizobiales bacterium GAS113]SEE95118.1 creatinine amidohydrolase [Rhizobiales bacterium GAS191]